MLTYGHGFPPFACGFWTFMCRHMLTYGLTAPLFSYANLSSLRVVLYIIYNIYIYILVGSITLLHERLRATCRLRTGVHRASRQDSTIDKCCPDAFKHRAVNHFRLFTICTASCGVNCPPWPGQFRGNQIQLRSFPDATALGHHYSQGHAHPVLRLRFCGTKHAQLKHFVGIHLTYNPSQ